MNNNNVCVEAYDTHWLLFDLLWTVMAQFNEFSIQYFRIIHTITNGLIVLRLRTNFVVVENYFLDIYLIYLCNKKKLDRNRWWHCLCCLFSHICPFFFLSIRMSCKPQSNKVSTQRFFLHCHGKMLSTSNSRKGRLRAIDRTFLTNCFRVICDTVP